MSIYRGESFRHRFANEWYVIVMGTGGVAVALQYISNRLWLVGTLFGAASAGLLACAIACSVSGNFSYVCGLRRLLSGSRAETTNHSRERDDQSLSSGTVPVAVITVGAAARTASKSGPFGDYFLVPASSILLIIGTILAALIYAVFGCILVRTVTRQVRSCGRPSISLRWLMPFVPPMVSASSLAYVLDSYQLPLVGVGKIISVACAAMFASAALSFVAIVTLNLLSRGSASYVTDYWIPLGVVGQSATAAYLVSHSVTDGSVWRTVCFTYSSVTMIFGSIVYLIVLALTVSRIWCGLEFGLGWWTFVFPTVTFVTAFGAGSHASNSTIGLSAWLAPLAGVFFVFLLNAWTVAASGTMYIVLRCRASSQSVAIDDWSRRSRNTIC